MSSLCSDCVIVGENSIVPSNVPTSHGFTVDPLNKNFDAKEFVMNECENAQPVSDTRSNLPKEAVFHAVYIPQDNNEDSVNIEGKNFETDT